MLGLLIIDCDLDLFYRKRILRQILFWHCKYNWLDSVVISDINISEIWKKYFWKGNKTRPYIFLAFNNVSLMLFFFVI